MPQLQKNKTNIQFIPLDTTSHQHLVRTFLKSGLSQKAFCEQYSIKESTFKNWVYRYQRSLLDQTSSDLLADMASQPIAVVDPSVLFVPVHITHDAPQEALMPRQSSRCASKSLSSSPSLRLETGAFCVTIPVGFDAETLRSVLSIVRAYP